METIVKILKRLGLCPNCEFPFLSENIMLGQRYVTIPDLPAQTYHVRCGGCGKPYDPGPTVLAFGILRPDDDPRPLPVALFEERIPSSNPRQSQG